jgi:hypothetical protein
MQAEPASSREIGVALRAMGGYWRRLQHRAQAVRSGTRLHNWGIIGMRKFMVAAAALAVMLASNEAALANETGIAIIHSWVKIGARTCFTDHYHYSSGHGPTRSHAQVAAIKSWTWPTALEYGSSWADYRLAAGKSMNCSRSRAVWTCDTQARPCRRY